MVREDPTVIPYSASPGQAAAKVSSGWRLEIAASTMLSREKRSVWLYSVRT
jgi:hypothetical protein